VVDEALAVGDAYFVQKCMRFLREFTQRGTLLFVSHDTSALVGLCSKALLMESGVLKRVGKPKDISELYLAMLHNEQHGAPPSKSASDTPFSFAAHNDFGVGAVKIISTDLRDETGASISSVYGGEYVLLTVEISSESRISQIIVGFLVRDRLGQVVFGENTYPNYGDRGLIIDEKQTIQVGFEFVMPSLQQGDYSITIAVAQGTQADHLQHHWVHDALIIHSRPDRIYSGLIAVPMNKVTFTCVEFRS